MAVWDNLQTAAILLRGQNPEPLCIILLGHRGKRKRQRIEIYFNCVKKNELEAQFIN
jgi:hypothetical protein